jgi:hypothetical protein
MIGALGPIKWLAVALALTTQTPGTAVKDAITLRAMSDGAGSVAVLASTQPNEPEYSTKNCEQYPHDVVCYRYGHAKSYACFPTLCEAAAAGYSRCTRKLSECEPALPPN